MTTTTTITATAAGELRGKRRRSGFLHAIPTTLFVNIPTDRDYARVLAQTEVVYDQLLEERRAKLERKISDKKQQFESKHLELVNSGDMIRAREFKRWSDAALALSMSSCTDELTSLREDYERKYTKLWQNLEAQWQAQLRLYGPQDGRCSRASSGNSSV